VRWPDVPDADPDQFSRSSPHAPPLTAFPAEEGSMNEMVYIIALVRCVSGPCEFAYPAPDMPSTSYAECMEKAKVFDFALANRYWTEVNCVELPKDRLAHFVLKGVGPR
jgi:hypothetical protein